MYEGSGTPTDVSSNAWTLTTSGLGSTLIWGTGQYGAELTFSGGSVTIPSGAVGALVGSLNVSVELWFYPAGSLSGYESLFDTASRQLSCFLGSSSTTLYVAVAGSTGSSTAGNFSTPLVLNTWQHLVMVCNGATIQIWINGLNVGGTSIGSSGIGTAFTPQAIQIGANPSGGGAAFQGSIDGFRVHNKVLTAAQIAQLYADNFSTYRLISPIQQTALQSATGVTGVGSSFGTLPTVGDAIIVVATGLCVSALSNPTCTDNQTGNSYTLTKFTQDSITGEFSAEFLLSAVVGSTGTFTVAVSVSAASILNAQAIEFNSGPSGSLAVDQVSGATGSGTSPAPGAVTTTSANEVIVTAFSSTDTTNPATITPPIGFYVTGQQLSGGLGGQAVGGIGYEVVSTTQTSENPTWATTNGGSPRWTAVQGTCKVSTSPPPPPTFISGWEGDEPFWQRRSRREVMQVIPR